MRNNQRHRWRRGGIRRLTGAAGLRIGIGDATLLA